MRAIAHGESDAAAVTTRTFAAARLAASFLAAGLLPLYDLCFIVLSVWTRIGPCLCFLIVLLDLILLILLLLSMCEQQLMI